MAFAHYEAHTPIDTAARPAMSDRNLTLLALLMLLVAALFVWYRYGEMRSNRVDPAVAPIVVTPTPAAAETRASTAVRGMVRPARRDSAAHAVAGSSSARPVIGNPLPEYPITALRRGEGGTVVLKVEVDQAGQPVDVDVARRSGSRELDRAAIQAVRDWRFKPAIRNGKPVSSVVELPIDFKPQG